MKSKSLKTQGWTIRRLAECTSACFEPWNSGFKCLSVAWSFACLAQFVQKSTAVPEIGQWQPIATILKLDST